MRNSRNLNARPEGPREPLASFDGETWRFSVECQGADRVYLVREGAGGASAWFEMNATGQGQWACEHHLTAGNYRFRYFRNDGTTYVNCGAYGLTGERLNGSDPGVRVESLRLAATA